MKRAVLLALGTAFLVGCQDSPTGLDFDSIDGAPSLDISDALHLPGNQHFFFLPPIVRKTKGKPKGELLEGLNPVVDIECLEDPADCPPGFPLRFTTQGGPRGKKDRIKEHRKDYRVKWDTKRFGLDDDMELMGDPVFRITVRVGELVLGFADVQLVERARGPGSPKLRKGIGRDSDPILLEDGRKLDIRFRIEPGALCEESAGTCIEETFEVAEGGTASGEFQDPNDPEATITAGLTIGGLGGSPAPASFQGASIGGLFSGFGVRSIHNVGNGLLGMPVAARAVQAASGQITVVIQDCVLLDEFGEPELDEFGDPIPVDLDLGIPTFGPCLDIKLFDETGARIRDLEQEATVFACVRGDLNVGTDLNVADLTPDQEELIRIHAQDDLQPTVALPLRRAEGCGDPIAGAGSSGFMRFARAVRDRMVSLVAPEPLHARRRRIDFLQGGAPPFFSRFQWALPAKMEKLEGTDNQRARLDEAVPNAPAVLVTDADGSPVKGALVSFAGGGTIVGPASPKAFSDENGIASLLSWTLTTPGESQVIASSFGIADPDDEARNGPAVGFDPFTPLPGDGDPGQSPDDGGAVVLETGMLAFTAEIHSILVYGPSMLAPSTFRPANEQTMAEAEGFEVTVWDAATWGSKATPDFAAFSAIVFGDRNDPADPAPPVLDAADANKSVWSAAITGPVLISALNPQIHQCDLAQPSCLDGSVLVHQPEAITLIKNAINFAASGTGTGAYISLDSHFDVAPANTAVTFLGGIGTFEVVGLGNVLSDAITIVAPPGHPVITAGTGLTDAGLSDWFASAHQFLRVFPTSYVELAQGERITLVGEGGEAEPIIDPVSGFFTVGAVDADGAVVLEDLDLRPFGSFSHTKASDHATSQLHVTVTNGGGSGLIALTHLMDIDDGGSESVLSFAIQFDLFQEATYEIFGGMSGSFTGSPEQDVQLETSVEFDDLNPFTGLFFEGDNSVNASPVNFTINGVNEGTIGGNVPSQGSLTGVLAPGRYGFNGTSTISSRGGGFSATGRTDLSIRLTPTGTPPEVSETLAVIVACSPDETTVCVVPSVDGPAPSLDASFDVAGGQSSSLSKVKVPKNIR